MMYPLVNARDAIIDLECQDRAIEEFNRVYGALLRCDVHITVQKNTPIMETITFQTSTYTVPRPAGEYIGVLCVEKGLFERIGIGIYKEGTAPHAVKFVSLLRNYPWFEKRFWWLVSKHLAEMKR